MAVFTDGSTDDHQDNSDAGIYIENSSRTRSQLSCWKTLLIISCEVRSNEMTAENPTPIHNCTEDSLLIEALEGNNWKDR